MNDLDTAIGSYPVSRRAAKRTATSIAGALWLSLALIAPARAQIVPDSTLPNNSIVTPNGRHFTLEGGTTAGSNLFHSFREFSIPTGSEAFFNNATTIDNIITRITGGNVSNIDGLIRASGSANLFLLNPNGIVFGPNARLDIGGSFFGATANSIVFENGLEFSTTSPEGQPLLTVSVPIGLQFGQNPGAIRVQGTGHNFSFGTGDIIRNGDSGLRVGNGQTLALVGGNITLEGGTLTAEQGRIELGSVAEGQASLSLTDGGWMLNYEGIGRFQDLSLSQQAAVDASGVGSGAIRIVSRQVTLREGSVVLNQNVGSQPSGSIRINASESVELLGINPDATFPSAVFSPTLGDGSGGDIAISTRQLVIRDSAQISARTFGPGRGGNVDLRVSESVDLIGVPLINPLFLSTIGSTTLGPGDAGNTMVSTARLSVRDGGVITVSTLGSGAGGALAVNATESVEVIGGDLTSVPSRLIAGTVAVGNGGDLTIDTPRLVLRESGQVSSFTSGSGNAGSIAINATESVEASGALLEGFPAGVTSNAQLATEIVQRLFGVPPIPSGTSGDVTINTPVLRLADGAQVTVANRGTGNAGSLQINANSIFLNDEGGITASTVSGEGGNIVLQVQDSLQLRDRGQISAEAGGTGNGGNIAIDTETIALLENSTITANAFEGNGGNISISTRGIFPSANSRITASSQFGVDGIVQINTPDVDSAAAAVELERDPISEDDRIVTGCASALENTFVVTGRGGLPSNPERQLRGDRPWPDLRDLSAFRGEITSLSPQATPPGMLVEANTLIVHPDGSIELVALATNSQPMPLPFNCASR